MRKRRESIPDAEEIYTTFFDRWYDDDDRRQKGFPHTRPDMLKCYRPRLEVSEITRLTDQSQAEVLRRIQVMLETAKTDWPTYLPVRGEIDEQWILKLLMIIMALSGSRQRSSGLTQATSRMILWSSFASLGLCSAMC